jgi:competence protein ComEC
LNQIPAVRYAIPLILGILFANWTKYNHDILWLPVALALALGILFAFLKIAWKYRFNGFIGFVYTLGIFALGWKCYTLHPSAHSGNHFAKFNGETLIWKVIEPPTEKNGVNRTPLLCLSNTEGAKRTGKIQAYWKGNLDLSYGDVIVHKGDADTIKAPLNPEEFDYKRFMAVKQIHHQVFLKRDSWMKIPKQFGNPIFKRAYALRAACKELLLRHFSGQEAAFLQAVILGDKNDLSVDARNTFSRTGTMHVLAVSGLHVGIIYLMLNILLGFVQRMRYGSVVKGFLILLFLFLFAAITGFSPSVSRASWMFGIITFGEMLGRKGNTLNSLAVSALILLIWDPNNIFKLGFQFSYVAVIGIVLLQPTIRRLFSTSDWLMDKVFNLMAVSIAAQLVTLPLGLYYFGQFSPIFLVSNLLIVPCISIVLYLGVAFFMFSWLPFFGGIIIEALKGYVWFILKANAFLESIPGAYLDSIYVSPLEFLLLVSGTFSLALYVLSNLRKWWIIISCYFFLGFFFFQTHHHSSMRTIKGLVYFRTQSSGVLTCIEGDTVLVLSDHSFDKQDWDYHCKPWFAKQGVKNPKIQHVRVGKDDKLVAVEFGGKTYLYGETNTITEDHFNQVEPNSVFSSYPLLEKNRQAVLDSHGRNITIVNEFHKILK